MNKLERGEVFPPTASITRAALLRLPAVGDNAAMSQASIERERLAHDVKLFSEQLGRWTKSTSANAKC